MAIERVVFLSSFYVYLTTFSSAIVRNGSTFVNSSLSTSLASTQQIKNNGKKITVKHSL